MHTALHLAPAMAMAPSANASGAIHTHHALHPYVVRHSSEAQRGARGAADMAHNLTTLIRCNGTHVHKHSPLKPSRCHFLLSALPRHITDTYGTSNHPCRRCKLAVCTAKLLALLPYTPSSFAAT